MGRCGGRKSRTLRFHQAEIDVDHSHARLARVDAASALRELQVGEVGQRGRPTPQKNPVSIVSVDKIVGPSSEPWVTPSVFSMTEDKDLSEKDKILQEKEAELKRMQEMITAMQAKMRMQQ